MSMIRLHETKGVNPHITYCPRCGKDVDLALLGALDRKFSCDECKTVSYGSTHCIKCRNDHKRDRDGKVEVIADTERVPGALCEECLKEMREHRAVVEAGGVYFRCVDCGCSGAIKSSEFAEGVRKAAGIAAPGACGVEFNKTDCPKCGAGGIDDRAKDSGG
jgi:hypothetical protein